MSSEGRCGRRLGLLVPELPGLSMGGFQLCYRLEIVGGSRVSIFEWLKSLVGAALRPMPIYDFSFRRWLWEFKASAATLIGNAVTNLGGCLARTQHPHCVTSAQMATRPRIGHRRYPRRARGVVQAALGQKKVARA